MKDHSENTLRAAIKSLRDTVAPAVDPADDQAQEQLRLTIDFLEFLRSRIYDLHARHRYELARQLEVAASLSDAADGIPGDAPELLSAALASALAVHADPASHTKDLQASSEELWGVVRTVVREARTAPAAVKQRVGACVLTGVGPLVEMESAWYLPFGFEPDPHAVTGLDDLLTRGR
jgi:hypothetical protein